MAQPTAAANKPQDPTNLPTSLKPQPESTSLTANISSTSESIGFDVEALTKKYTEEREKRLKYKPLGVDEYRTVEGGLSHLLEDPAVVRTERDPIQKSCEALIIGGGYGAQLVAVRLIEAGITDVAMVEKGGDFGGTWYWVRHSLCMDEMM